MGGGQGRDWTAGFWDAMAQAIGTPGSSLLLALVFGVGFARTLFLLKPP